MEKIKNYYNGRYGWDFLSKYLVVLGLLFLITRSIFSIAIGLFIIAYSVWRSISKNKSERYKELLAFQNFLYKIRQKFFSLKRSFLQFKDYKVFTCPDCKQKLRVPRKKGKITVICKKCGKRFEGRS